MNVLALCLWAGLILTLALIGARIGGLAGVLLGIAAALLALGLVVGVCSRPMALFLYDPYSWTGLSLKRLVGLRDPMHVRVVDAGRAGIDTVDIGEVGLPSCERYTVRPAAATSDYQEWRRGPHQEPVSVSVSGRRVAGFVPPHAKVSGKYAIVISFRSVEVPGDTLVLQCKWRTE